ncbi:MAG: 30S ribosomal protein S4, partial [Faecalibacterium sp.]
ECRLDNVVFRLGFAQTRRDARQLVSHAHFTVNGKKVNIPSYQVKAGDVIEVRESSRSSAKFAKLTGAEAPVVALPAWLNRETGSLKGVVAKLPERSDIDYEVAEHLIVELYSK